MAATHDEICHATHMAHWVESPLSSLGIANEKHNPRCRGGEDLGEDQDYELVTKSRHKEAGVSKKQRKFLTSHIDANKNTGRALFAIF